MASSICAVPTKQLNNRKVFVAKDITLNARFSMLSSMRQHASQQQSERRDSVLAKKRGLKPAAGPSQVKVSAEMYLVGLHQDFTCGSTAPLPEALVWA